MYVYRFIDTNNEIIYVGKTVNIDRRMSEHFGGKGHLDVTCYKSTARIEYMKFDTEVDSLIAETYFINLYRPRYNKLNKTNKVSKTTLIDIEPNFKLYKEFKPAHTVSKGKSFAIGLVLQVVFWACIFYTLFKFFLSL